MESFVFGASAIVSCSEDFDLASIFRGLPTSDIAIIEGSAGSEETWDTSGCICGRILGIGTGAGVLGSQA